MKAPDKIFVVIRHPISEKYTEIIGYEESFSDDELKYIRKDALLEWVQKEMERLWELLPDASNDNPTQMELRYLGQYMQMEALEDKLNEM